MNLILFMHNPPVAEHPNQRAVVKKRFYLRIGFSETLFLIMIFLYLKLRKVIGVPRVIVSFQYKEVVEKPFILIKKSF